MKIRCPACGNDFDLDQAVKDRDLEALVQLAAGFGAEWPLVSEYLDAFRTAGGYARTMRPLAVKKRLRLAREVLAMWDSGKFAIGGRWYVVGRQEFKEALAEVANRELTGLKNHNYLKQVLKAAAEKTSQRRERELREREGRMMAGRDACPTMEDNLPDDPEWRREFQRLLKRSLAKGLDPEEQARRQAEFAAFVEAKPCR